MKERSKARRAENITISVSMSKELKRIAFQMAKERGANHLSVLVRELLTAEWKKCGAKP